MFTEEELAGLSEVERDALRDLQEDDEDVRGAAGDDDDAGTATDPADPTDPTDPADDDAGAAPGAGNAAGAPGAADGSAAPELPPELPVQAALQPVTPEDADDQRKTLRAEKATALQQLLDGEIDQEKYQEVEARVQDKLDDLARAAAVDMARTQLQRDSMLAEYGQHLAAVQKELKAAGIDLDGDAGPQFDRAIRLFAQEAGERGLTDTAGNMAASRDALAEAKALVLRRFGKAEAAAPAAGTAAAAPKPAARRPAPPDRSTLPPTLAGVPTAADAAVGSEFAHLESLEGTALERAIAAMTPAQQDRYLGA
ncbi:hypothetical protein [Comamonas antarctica]|uniref:hypothetical protein n=1 Tax=Comamonas antarctica TaxID=2743470 RepID=UPI0028E1920A|nr:hypothetical protein [Comamonas antarctica]